jgi:hypothetical protein
MKEERKAIIALIRQARDEGVRQSKACGIIGISSKTLQCWSSPDNVQDGRIESKHEPANKLTERECQRIIHVANKPEYASFPANKIVPKLADRGIYIASESSFYRILKKRINFDIDKNQSPSGRSKNPGH